MRIMVAGPYSAPTEEQRGRNAQNINRIAAEVLKKGHIPIVGINAALPVVQAAGMKGEEAYEGIMRISLTLAEMCEAILCIGTSKGVEREKGRFVSRGCPVYTELGQLP